MTTQTKEKPKSKAQLKREAEQLIHDEAGAEIKDLMNQRAAKLAEKQALELQEANALAPIQKKYADEMKPVADMYEPKIASLSAAIDTYEKQILELCYDPEKKKVLHRPLFDVSGNFRFDALLEYLHIKHTAEVWKKPGFNLSKFINKFGQYVKIDFNIKDLKTLLADGDARKKSGIDKYKIDIKYAESVEFKIKKEKNDEQEKETN